MSRDRTAATTLSSKEDEVGEPGRYAWRSVPKAGPDISVELSTASAEFAAELLREGPLGAEEQIVTAALHLRYLVDLVPESDRLSFLFSCWQFWTSRMAPQERIGLGVRGDLDAVEILGAACALRRTVADDPAWRTYLDRTRALTVDRAAGTSGPPANYLLFQHAHLTHARLGLTAEAEALAARALRCGLSGAVPAPDPLATALQSA